MARLPFPLPLRERGFEAGRLVNTRYRLRTELGDDAQSFVATRVFDHS